MPPIQHGMCTYKAQKPFSALYPIKSATNHAFSSCLLGLTIMTSFRSIANLQPHVPRVLWQTCSSPSALFFSAFAFLFPYKKTPSNPACIWDRPPPANTMYVSVVPESPQAGLSMSHFSPRCTTKTPRHQSSLPHPPSTTLDLGLDFNLDLALAFSPLQLTQL